MVTDQSVTDLTQDLTDSEKAEFAADVALCCPTPTRDDLIALRIAGDPDLVPEHVPIELGFVVVRALVAAGRLDESDIDRRTA